MSLATMPTAPAHDAFGAPLPADALARLSRSGWLTNLAARGAGQLIRFTTLVVLARLLAPADFGVLAMAFAIIGIGEAFKDLGLSAATLRAPSITRSQVNTLFWMNAGLGLAMAAAGVAVAPWLGTLYDDARIPGVAGWLSLSFLLSGFGVQHGALLQRALRFRELAACQLGAAVVGSIVAVVCAWAGAGYWALVAAALTQSAAATALRWRWCDWRPGRPAYDRSAGRMVSFGGYLVVFSILGFLAHNLHLALIGWLWGAAVVGLFSRAYLVYAVPLGYITDPVNAVAQATLSRLAGDTAAFRAYYLRTTTILVALAAPASVLGMALADALIAALLGSRWLQAAPFLAWFAAGLVPQVICYTSGWLYLARGDSRAMMRWGVMGWSALIACLLAALPFGLQAVAMAYAGAMFLLVVPCMTLAFRGTPVALAQLAAAVWRPLAAAAVAAVVPTGLAALWQPPGAWPRLLLDAPLYLVAYALLLAGPFGERALLVELVRTLRLTRRPRGEHA